MNIYPIIPIAEKSFTKQALFSKRDRVTTDSLKLYFREISKVPLLTAKEEVELSKGIEKGDLKSKQKLVAANLRCY